MRMMSMAGLGRPVHHPQHPKPTGSQEPQNEQGGKDEEDDIEPGRVVPRNGGLDHPRMALRRDETESTKTQLDNQRDSLGSPPATGCWSKFDGWPVVVLDAPVVQHRAAIIDPAPFGALLRAIDGYDGTLVVRSALQLLALTFTRPGELRLATWKEFDLDAGVWTIPANRMKMRRPHRIPLASQTISVLEVLRTLTGQYELL
jgi:hypothetical protein